MEEKNPVFYDTKNMKVVRESIFISAIRSFSSCFAGILGILIGAIVIFFLINFFSGPNIYPQKTELELRPDANGQIQLLSDSSPAVLEIYVHGIVGEGDLASAKIDKILRESREGMLKNNRVKAVLLHINTPGGEATNADDIYTSLVEYKKKYKVPIYAFVDGLCASGGMYIASAADKIYASPTSTIGSVGIILGPAFNLSQAMDKLGIQSLTLTQGKDKDMLNPFRPWQAGEYDSLKTILSDLYDRFVTVVTDARPRLDKEKLVDVYGAQVYLSPRAQELGYIDVACANYNQTLADLVNAAGVEENQPYQVVRLEIPHPFLAQLAGGKSPLFTGKVTHQLQINPQISPELSGKFLYLYQPVSQ